MRLTLDLHLHSQASPDGRMTVEEIAAARARGLHGVAGLYHDVKPTGPTEVDGVLLIPGWSSPRNTATFWGLFVRQPMVYTTWEGPPRPSAGWGTDGAGPSLSAPEGGGETGASGSLSGWDGDLEWPGQPEESPGQRPGTRLCQDYGLIPTAGSDAHLAQEIGNGTITVEAADRDPPRHSDGALDGKGWITGRKAPSLCVAQPIYQVEKRPMPPSALWKVGGVRP